MAGPILEFVYGINAVAEMIKHSAKSIDLIYLQTGRDDKRLAAISAAAKQAGIAVNLASKSEITTLLAPSAAPSSEGLDAIEPNHQGVIAACRPSQAQDESFLDALIKRTESPLLLLVLDGVTDPHNLGACLRSADAAGANAVIIPKDNAVGLTPVVRKVASGAAETTPLVVVKNLARAIKNLQTAGIWVMGAAGETEQSLFQLDLTGHTALVMGAEGGGLRRLTRERCDSLFKIPMHGAVESLNVSVAAGVSLFEALRQRH
tara:strand:- start:1462 stop:2247 length:786 start_codon:yes stop_codon:yes gene_type:complete